jgi:hypothetical protein
MTETIKYQSHCSQHHAETSGLFVRRLVSLRRYGRLLSQMALLGQIIFNVQSNLSSGAFARTLRRSR